MRSKTVQQCPECFKWYDPWTVTGPHCPIPASRVRVKHISTVSLKRHLALRQHNDRLMAGLKEIMLVSRRLLGGNRATADEIDGGNE